MGKTLGKHRSRLNILANILSVVSDNNGAKKTQIMYQAYLSYKLLVQYLKDVTDAGLIMCEDETFYKLTEKGEQFLAKFREYDKSRKYVDKQLNNIENQKLMLDALCPNTEESNDDSSTLVKTIGRRTEK